MSPREVESQPCRFRVGCTIALSPVPPREREGAIVTEVNLRVRTLNTLLAMPHGKLAVLAPFHQEAIANDPLFYGHLAVWYNRTGEVRDHRVLFAAHLLTSEYPEHRAAGWVLLQQLPPHMVAAAVDHAKRTIGKMPRIFRSAVYTYLNTMEAHPARFDRAAARSRQALKHLYATLRLKPGARAQATLFDEQPPAGSMLAQVKDLAKLSDPDEQAIAILLHNIPYTTAVGALRAMTPAVLVALVEVMTPQEVINHLKSLQRHGAFENAEVKALIDEKLHAAQGDKRVSTLKATRAMAHVDLDDATRAVLTEVTDQRVAQIAHIARPTAMFVDKSGSMTAAIELAKEMAALVSAITDEFHALAFDTEAFDVTATETTRSAWETAFRLVKAGGGTSIGAPLAKLHKDGVVVEQIIVITDGGENTAPYFAPTYQAYSQALGVAPNVTIVGVGSYAGQFTATLNEAGIPVTAWEFTGDYYSLPNLLPLLSLPSRADLVDEIMALALPTRFGDQEAIAS